MTSETEHQDKTSSRRPHPRGAADEAGLVPSRRQYLDLKSQHPDAILLYRLGDFYETFDDDAKTAARDARITLTSRNFGRNGRVPMAGIPHHALNHYLGRLLHAGHTVAIAEQMSEPGRGLVERAITRVLTPGTIAEPALLPAGENRYLAAIAARHDRLGLAWVDVSTGEFAALELSGQTATAQLGEELARLNPAEYLVPDDFSMALEVNGHRTRLEHWHFEPNRARDALCRQFGVRSLTAYGCDDAPAAIGAAGAILAYLERTNPRLLPMLTGLRTEEPGRHVNLDRATRRNLELTRSVKSGGSRGTLLGVLDQSRTAMGTRALRRLLGQPLRDLEEIRRRQGIVAGLIIAPIDRAALAIALAAIGDLERLVGRVTQGVAAPRDLLALGAALRIVPDIAVTLCRHEAAVQTFGHEIDNCADLLDLIDSAVDEDEDGSARIRPGFSAELDASVAGARETRVWLADLERHERERTGIRSLKVGYNKVFGYYIEVTRSNLSLVPVDYTRKQTVASGERYITTHLKEAEARIAAADEEIDALERAALACISARITTSADRLIATANRLAVLDALLSLADVAAARDWVAPRLDEGDSLEIIGGRHPVVEAHLAGEAFIPNDCHLGDTPARLLLVTGPNMGGKSTYLRQVALIVLLAQIGSFVPASSARIGLVDRIFTRVGAHDNLAGGASTFMVEMIETATILHHATRRSLVVLDEVGRGTTTGDGLAIARAVVEDLHGRIGARTLFATHYLELTSLTESLPGVANVHVAALESEGRVIFLYAVRPGPADRSYGVQVARLAGLPSWVADRAASVLAELPDSHTANEYPIPPPAPNGYLIAESSAGLQQLPLDGIKPPLMSGERLLRALRELDLDHLTPREAMDWLFDQRARLA